MDLNRRHMLTSSLVAGVFAAADMLPALALAEPMPLSLGNARNGDIFVVVRPTAAALTTALEEHAGRLEGNVLVTMDNSSLAVRKLLREDPETFVIGGYDVEDMANLRSGMVFANHGAMCCVNMVLGVVAPSSEIARKAIVAAWDTPEYRKAALHFVA